MQLSSGPRHLVKGDFNTISVHSYSGRASIEYAIKVDFHCHVIFFGAYAHKFYARKVEAMYEGRAYTKRKS